MKKSLRGLGSPDPLSKDDNPGGGKRGGGHDKQEALKAPVLVPAAVLPTPGPEPVQLEAGLRAQQDRAEHVCRCRARAVLPGGEEEGEKDKEVD